MPPNVGILVINRFALLTTRENTGFTAII